MTTEPIVAASQFPWGNLITAGAALGGTIAGSILTYIFGKKNWERQVGYEIEKENLKIFREKSEELHILVSKWGKYICNIQLLQLSVALGKLTEKSFHELLQKDSLESGTHDSLEALLFLYFPKLVVHTAELGRITANSSNAFFSLVNGQTLAQEAAKTIKQSITSTEIELKKLKSGIRELARKTGNAA